MKWGARFLLSIALAIFTVPVNAAGSKLSEQQLEQMHEEVCSVPPHKGAGQESGIWLCDVPRGYKSELPHYFNDNDPNYRACPLSFNVFGAFKPPRVYYGQFTEKEPQALAVYRAGCEPHANNGGGMALFRMVEDQFKLIRYYVGIAPNDCVVPPALGGQLQKPYCISSYMGQGELSEGFGPLDIGGNGNASMRPLLSAGNIDGMLAVSATDCPRPNPAIHDFVALTAGSEGDIVVEGRYLSPRSVDKACRRFKRKDFSDDETELRKISSVANSMAFVREDEEIYLKVLAIFSADGMRKGISFTSQRASPGRF